MQFPGQGLDGKLWLTLIDFSSCSTVEVTHSPPSAPRDTAVHVLPEQLAHTLQVPGCPPNTGESMLALLIAASDSSGAEEEVGHSCISLTVANLSPSA